MMESSGLVRFTVTTSNCPSAPGRMARGPMISFLGLPLTSRGGDRRLGGSRLTVTVYRQDPVQAQHLPELLVGLAEQVAAQRADRGDVEGDQRDQGDGQHPEQHPGAQLGPAGQARQSRQAESHRWSRGSRRL